MVSITLTGADERTPLDELIGLADSGAEIGILLSLTNKGSRYPSLEWIGKAAELLQGRASIHVCGYAGRTALFQGNLNWLLGRVRRFQVNGCVLIGELERLCEANPDSTVITQHKAYNLGLLACKAKNHAILVDDSGGTGTSPKRWIRPKTEKCVGFAGGLGADNLADELARIGPLLGDGWIDMESKLRTDDWFDAEKARACLAVYNEWTGSQFHGVS